MPEKPKSTYPSTRCKLVTTSILLTGFGTAAIIYLSANEIPDNPFAEFEQSKRFSHEVQRMGGKLALVANDASAWFASLWQGRQLAITVVCITVVTALLYYFIATGIKTDDK
jgi:hypothetical protein